MELYRRPFTREFKLAATIRRLETVTSLGPGEALGVLRRAAPGQSQVARRERRDNQVGNSEPQNGL